MDVGVGLGIGVSLVSRKDVKSMTLAELLSNCGSILVALLRVDDFIDGNADDKLSVLLALIPLTSFSRLADFA